MTQIISLVLVLLLANSLLHASHGRVQTDEHQDNNVSAANQRSRWPELKFQTELDNSTVIKQLEQQQIFKCQVRLAPNGVGSQRPARIKWSFRPLEAADEPLAPLISGESEPSASWATNVTRLTLEWLKDDRPLAGDELEPLVVINVTLRGREPQQATQNRSRRPRVEVKNTLNGAQVKLTSRLRLARLKPSDAGRYKCVARASLIQREHAGATPLQVDQVLESNATVLIVSSAISNSNAGARKKWSPTNPDARSRGEFSQTAGPKEELRDGSDTRPSNQVDGLADTSTWRSASNPSASWALFEDDEDLFRGPTELINGHSPTSANEENNDNTSNQELMIESSDNGEPADQHDAYLNWVLGRQESDRFMADDGASPAANTNDRSPNQQEQQPASLSPLPPQRNQVSSFLHGQPAEPAGHAFKLAKLVHKIAPELSCYTGVGEYYHGLIATALDQRPCLNWLHVRLALAPVSQRPANRSNSLASRQDNHNACRNPNSDARGPWCFVAHSEQLDGPLVQPVSQQRGPRLQAGHKQQRVTVWLGANGQLFVIRPCAIASCSQYLWLYVVAPPLGLLVLLTCLASVAIRAIRKSHYNAIFSAAYQRHSNASTAQRPHSPGSMIARGLAKVFRARSRRRAYLSTLGNKSKISGQMTESNEHQRPTYMEDDDFEIADEIDWSEGQTPTSSMASPKSGESFKLSAPFSNAVAGKSTLSHSKSVNPMFSEHAIVEPQKKHQQQAPQPPPRLSSNAMMMSKSKSQAGPMFATLRCHVRSTQMQRFHADTSGRNTNLQQKSSFIDNADLASRTSDWLGPNLPSESNSNNQTSNSVKTGRLISCSSSSTSNSSSAFATACEGDKFILARDLPQIAHTSVTITHEMQPIYEGKFSQVQWAYLKQRDSDPAQATGRIGAQVAVCGLKPQQQAATLDERVFHADQLRLRHLNHLNVLKLIGYVQFESDFATCSLVYDMAHLMDLSDWLKEQSKEAVLASADEPAGDLSLRQNLTCLAKQIALAVDYLHDKQIVYKDLACRNCFLDVTRMLVKLASFNIEPEFEQTQALGEYDVPQHAQICAPKVQSQMPLPAATATATTSASSDSTNNNNADDINKRLNLKSMVRPKYLLDYYVIDSRPSECQLLPLSWIPLESILFNKFNRQTDIWSFGCLLYELFSLGEVAYFGYSSKQVIDSVRANLMPPQPMLCPNGIYKLMCKCLSDIPTLRPNIKHVYEQLNLYSGQCSSFLNHHLCII